jgi:rhodanese-related sulfurtransferase
MQNQHFVFSATNFKLMEVFPMCKLRITRCDVFRVMSYCIAVLCVLSILCGFVRESQAYTNKTPAECLALIGSGEDLIIVDVREQSEWNGGHIPDAILMPWNSGYLSAHYAELPNTKMIVHCKAGGRSAAAAAFLDTKGFTDVINMPGGFDQWKVLAPPAQVITYNTCFCTGPEGWSFAGQVAGFDMPTSGTDTGPGSIDMNPAGSFNCFSYFFSSDISVENRKYYRSTWTVGSDVTDADDAVQFRLRASQKGAWGSWARTVNSNKGNAPVDGTPKDYTVHFRPCVTGTNGDDKMVFAFDLLSFDQNDDVNSWTYLDELTIEEVVPFISDDHTLYDFSNGVSGWTFKGTIGQFTTPSSSTDNDRLGLSPCGSANCFSYWESPDIQIEADTVYRAIFEVESSTTAADDSVQFRVRANQKGAWSEWERIVNSYCNNAPCSCNSKEYDLVLDPVVTDTEDNDIVLAFDILSFDLNDDTDSWLYVYKVDFEEIYLVP